MFDDAIEAKLDKLAKNKTIAVNVCCAQGTQSNIHPTVKTHLTGISPQQNH